MTLIVNGSTVELANDASVIDAVRFSGHEGGLFGIAVALNGEVVPKSLWDSTRLTESDRVEVLVAAQGG
jgi:sulfur carrier protein